MIHSVVENVGSLVLAFLLAVMVWMVAINQGVDPPVRLKYPEGGFEIRPVNQAEDLMLLEPIGTRVQVELRGPKTFIEELTRSDFEVTVDLSELGPGVHENVPVIVKCLRCEEKRVNFLGWEPKLIRVALDKLEEKTIPVETNLQGVAAAGFQPKLPEITADPPTVVVSGPSSLVQKVIAARADIYLFNNDATFQKEMALIPVDEAGTRVFGVTLKPDRSLITVPIVPAGHFKEVFVTPTIVGTVAPGFYPSNITVRPQTVVLTGPRALIQSAPGFVETEPVSIAGARGLVEVKVPIRVPEGLKLSDPTSEIVTVRVEVSPFTGGRTFEVQPSIENLALGLVAEVSPPQVQVILSGPVPDLDALSADDIQVVLDLAGLAPGLHRIRPEVSVGRETVEIRTLPEELEVTITGVVTPVPNPTATAP